MAFHDNIILQQNCVCANRLSVWTVFFSCHIISRNSMYEQTATKLNLVISHRKYQCFLYCYRIWHYYKLFGRVMKSDLGRFNPIIFPPVLIPGHYADRAQKILMLFQFVVVSSLSGNSKLIFNFLNYYTCVLLDKHVLS